MSKTFKTPKGTELPIMSLKGKDYLEVKYRLVWFREERPTWGIETRVVDMSDKHAVFTAVVKDEQGRILASGHKHEDKAGFADFREKAETGAIGRALALLGYGTQFTGDELDEGERIVDSPVQRKITLPSGKTFMPSPIPQPGPEDGTPMPGYRIPFGKFKARTLEEVGAHELGSYVNYLEGKAEKEGKPIQGQVADFIERASAYIGSWENENLGPGARG